MSNIRRPAVVPLFTLLVLFLLVPCDGKKNLHRKRCPMNRNVNFPSVMHVHLNESEEFQWHVDDASNRSLSPWIYSHDENSSRVLYTIRNANCHDSCVDSNGNVDLNLSSVPIKQEILVLHQEMKGCQASFKLKIMMVSVGCTCVRN
ncbi:interleukin-17A-like [Rana temporaria]|uniref:interleukin-17A-like n=1 Tax=Rana temporaria TaxID=8407 RepID=UPI001AACC722|nr:interleukin-17A-like [Rana temporaria]